MANWESTNWLFFVLFKSAETVYKLKKIEKKNIYLARWEPMLKYEKPT